MKRRARAKGFLRLSKERLKYTFIYHNIQFIFNSYISSSIIPAVPNNELSALHITYKLYILFSDCHDKANKVYSLPDYCHLSNM